MLGWPGPESIRLKNRGKRSAPLAEKSQRWRSAYLMWSYICACRLSSLCSYGPGEYFVGVVSKGIPSRFALRVSAASPADEVSTHMRTAAAIVDNLAIMSNMDPHVREGEGGGGEKRVQRERERKRDVRT